MDDAGRMLAKVQVVYEDKGHWGNWATAPLLKVPWGSLLDAGGIGLAAWSLAAAREEGARWNVQPVLLGRWATRHGAAWSRVPRILFWPGLRLRLQLQLRLDARAVRKNEGRVVTGVLGSCAIWTAWVAERQRVGFWCLSVGVSLSWDGGRELPGTEEEGGGAAVRCAVDTGNNAVVSLLCSCFSGYYYDSSSKTVSLFSKGLRNCLDPFVGRSTVWLWCGVSMA